MLQGTISFGSTTYTIDSTRTPSNCHFGTCDFRTNTITIDDTLSPENFAKTLVHEIVHAMLYEYGLYQVDFDENEDITRKLAKPIYDFLHDNPNFGMVMNELLRPSKGSCTKSKPKKSVRKPSGKSKGNGNRSDSNNDLPPNDKPRKNRSKKNS